MNVQDLIDQLSELNPEARVRIAYQPNYPLWGVASNAVAGDDDGNPISDECPECGYTGAHHPDCDQQDIDLDQNPASAEFVYIATSDSASGYASRSLWN